jgi:hypothetical protein
VTLRRGFYFFQQGRESNEREGNERENDDRESSNYNGGETDRNRLDNILRVFDAVFFFFFWP